MSCLLRNPCLLTLVLAGACAIDEPAVDAPPADGAPDADAPPADSTPADDTDAVAVDGHEHPLDGMPTADADAPGGIDAMPVAITTVPCSGATIAATVFTAKSDYSPEQVLRGAPNDGHRGRLNDGHRERGVGMAPRRWASLACAG